MFGIIKKMFIVSLTGIVNASNHSKCVSLSNKNLLLSIYVPMNTVKNYATIHFQLNHIDVLEVVLLLMIYLIKYVFQIKQKI